MRLLTLSPSWLHAFAFNLRARAGQQDLVWVAETSIAYLAVGDIWSMLACLTSARGRTCNNIRRPSKSTANLCDFDRETRDASRKTFWREGQGARECRHVWRYVVCEAVPHSRCQSHPLQCVGINY